MIARIILAPTVRDSRAEQCAMTIKSRFPNLQNVQVTLRNSYVVDAQIDSDALAAFSLRLTNPIVEQSSTSEVFAPESFSCLIETGYLPGVTDNVGSTAREMLAHVAGRELTQDEAVYSSLLYFLDGVSETEAKEVAELLYNSLIERATIISAADYAKNGAPIIVPKVHLGAVPETSEVNLDVSEEELINISRAGIMDANGLRRGPLALPIKSMQAIRDYFRTEKRNPRDIEIEMLAQTWSEHCKHTIFGDPLDEITEGIYRRYIKGATQKIRADKGAKDFCVSVFTDNAGGIIFDDQYLVTHKVETHNSPSALDPFGGAVTGIVGVNRDALGFGKGSKPIANIYGFCVGNPLKEIELYRDNALTRPVLSARRILEGVVKGVNAGGNQSGIPTPLGFVAVDESFNAKPLVFAGTVGLIPRSINGKPSHEKSAQPGDLIVMAGGRVGLDGIHGATFSSESLTEGSPATAVQIGDPITQKKMSDAIVREARALELYNSITDMGAGGLSGSTGEMSREAGGCIVNLDKVPLKYPGLAAWQIWISESQERMLLSVPPSKWPQLQELFKNRGVEATAIGEFTKEARCIATFHGKEVMNMSMDFLHDGRPKEEQRSAKPTRNLKEPVATNKDLAQAIIDMVGHPNIASTAFVNDQYDQEVQGTSVTKPLQGKGRVNANGVVMKAILTSEKGIVLSHGLVPQYSTIDTYKMAAASIDTAIRNAICAGASRDYLAILDNFCWSSSNTPERLYELKEAARACYDVAVAYGTPYISGKDSMFNDFRGFDKNKNPVHLAALPTLLVSTIGVIENISRAITIDLKIAGDAVFLIGTTTNELGASEYYFQNGGELGTSAPTTDTTANATAYDALTAANQESLIQSAISVERGGLAAALAKTCIAGQLGISGSPTFAGNASTDEAILFSESQGRMLISVAQNNVARFSEIFADIPHTRLGDVTEQKEISLALPQSRLKVSVEKLTESYRAPFKNW